jgi:hypothetical protein
MNRYLIKNNRNPTPAGKHPPSPELILSDHSYRLQRKSQTDYKQMNICLSRPFKAWAGEDHVVHALHLWGEGQTSFHAL